jgi:hypothetical protein
MRMGCDEQQEVRTTPRQIIAREVFLVHVQILMRPLKFTQIKR